MQPFWTKDNGIADFIGFDATPRNEWHTQFHQDNKRSLRGIIVFNQQLFEPTAQKIQLFCMFENVVFLYFFHQYAKKISKLKKILIQCAVL